MLFIHICILDSYVDLCQNQSCQFQIHNCHVNFKIQQSCQLQTLAILSNSSSCSHVKSISIQFVSVNGQVASSHPRTACACQFILVINQVASSHPRTACSYQFSLVISQVASSYPRTACACALCLLSAKRLVQIQEQLVLPTFLSAK